MAKLKCLEKYFEANTEATYKRNIDGKLCLVSADKEIRVNTAKVQYEKEATPITTVISYVNEFLDMVSNNGSFNKPQLECIRIDGSDYPIIDRAIIVKDCSWQAPIYDKKKKRYISWDSKYNIIQEQFDLKAPQDIIWLKFTEDGYLGVVADSFDINFRYDNSSGKLIRAIDKTKKWNTSFVVIFPLTKDLLASKFRKEIETAVGNYLIEKGVPIIDYFSHNNFLY